MSLHMVEEKTPQPDAPAPVYILGVRVDRYSQERALDAMVQMIARYRDSAKQLPCQQVITVNTEFVMMAQHDSIFRQCINQSSPRRSRWDGDCVGDALPWASGA